MVTETIINAKPKARTNPPFKIIVDSLLRKEVHNNVDSYSFIIIAMYILRYTKLMVLFFKLPP